MFVGCLLGLPPTSDCEKTQKTLKNAPVRLGGVWCNRLIFVSPLFLFPYHRTTTLFYAKIKLLSMNGQFISDLGEVADGTTIDLSGIANGRYLISIVNGMKSEMHEIIITK